VGAQATMGTFTVTAFYSHTMWNFNVTSNMTCGQCFELVFYASAIVFNFPVALWNVYLYVSQSLSIPWSK
jgi:hypothetical protein